MTRENADCGVELTYHIIVLAGLQPAPCRKIQQMKVLSTKTFVTSLLHHGRHGESLLYITLWVKSLFQHKTSIITHSKTNVAKKKKKNEELFKPGVLFYTPYIMSTASGVCFRGDDLIVVCACIIIYLYEIIHDSCFLSNEPP